MTDQGADSARAETNQPAAADAAARYLVHAPCAAYRLDAARRVLWWNSAAETLFGWAADEVLGRPLPAGCRDTPELQQLIEERLSTGRSVDRVSSTRYDRDGAALSLVVTIEPVTADDGHPAGEIVLAARADDRLELGRDRLTALLDKTGEAVGLVDRDGIILSTSETGEGSLGYPTGRWQGHHVTELLHPDDRDRAVQHIERLTARPGVPLVERFRARHSQGHWEHLEVTGVNLLHDRGVGALVLTARRVTERALTASLESGSARTLELIASGAPMPTAIAEACSIVSGAIPGALAAVVLARGDVTVHAPDRFPDELRRAIAESDASSRFGTWAQTLRTGRECAASSLATDPPYASHRTLVDALGLQASLSVPIPAGDPDGAVMVVYLDQPRTLTDGERRVVDRAVHLVAVAVQRELDLDRLSHLALHDDLTGLPNRAMLQEQLHTALRVAANHGTAVAIMFLDLDDFKLVNDSLGHAVGDAVLRGFAGRLVGILRPGDAVARFGGDEFIVVLENVAGADDAITVAERLLADLRRPISTGTSEIFLTASIGIAVSTGDDTPDAILHDADAAMYRAKERGRSCIEVHDRSVQTGSSRRLRLQNDLRRALDGDELELRWQPKVDSRTGAVVGAEVLVRWEHPTRGLLTPNEFVPEAEESGLIAEVGAWVLERAARGGAELARRAPGRPWTMAVNVSGHQVGLPGFAAQVAQVLRTADFPAEQVIVELTESSMMADSPTVTRVLDQLRASGVALAIDDFGTGYSSLAYLHRLPIDIVKLDRAFVAGLDADGSGSPIAAAVVHIAKAFGLKVVAEGVETDDQLAGLRALDVDWVQGHLLFPPLELDEFADLLS